jgi:hypothetical protein
VDISILLLLLSNELNTFPEAEFSFVGSKDRMDEAAHENAQRHRQLSLSR